MFLKLKLYVPLFIKEVKLNIFLIKLITRKFEKDVPSTRISVPHREAGFVDFSCDMKDKENREGGLSGWDSPARDEQDQEVASFVKIIIGYL